MKWNDLTIEQFVEISKLYEMPIQDEDRSILLAQICFPNKTFDLNMPYAELMKYINEINKLGEIKYNKVKKFVHNEKKYNVSYDIKKFSTSQYIDFTTYAKEKKPLWYTLSVVCVPEGHTYNDGYDIDSVIEEMKTLPTEVALSINFTIAKSSSKFIVTFANSLKKQILKETMKEWFRSQKKK